MARLCVAEIGMVESSIASGLRRPKIIVFHSAQSKALEGTLLHRGAASWCCLVVQWPDALAPILSAPAYLNRPCLIDRCSVRGDCLSHEWG